MSIDPFGFGVGRIGSGLGSDPVWGPQSQENAFRWATVTGTAPLQVLLDGDTDPLGASPDTLMPNTAIAVGSRVWVQLFGRRALILGVGGGAAAPLPYWARIQTTTSQAQTVNTVYSTVFTTAFGPVSPSQGRNGAAPGRWTSAGWVVPEDGIYEIQAGVSLQIVAAGRYRVSITSNGSDITGSVVLTGTATGNTNVVATSIVQPLAAGDVIGVNYVTYGNTATMVSVSMNIAGPFTAGPPGPRGPAGLVSNQPRASMSAPSGQSIPNAVSTRVEYDTVEYSDGITCSTGGASAMAVVAAGLYRVTAALVISNAATATGIRRIYLKVNGTHVARVGDVGSNLGAFSVIISRTLALAAGDSVNVDYEQTSGGALAVAGDGQWNYFQMERVGDVPV